jgi:hypothetical protein
MDPLIILSIVGAIASSVGVRAALEGFVKTILSREERAGRSFGKIIRDAISGTPEVSPPEPTLEERIQSLSNVMAESAKLLEQVTAEIELRATFAKEKKEEADVAIAAATLNQDQLQALQRVVRTEVSTESNRGIRAALLVGVFSFILGIAATILIALFVHPLHESHPVISPSARPHPTSSSTNR